MREGGLASARGDERVKTHLEAQTRATSPLLTMLVILLTNISGVSPASTSTLTLADLDLPLDGG